MLKKKNVAFGLWLLKLVKLLIVHIKISKISSSAFNIKVAFVFINKEISKNI